MCQGAATSVFISGEVRLNYMGIKAADWCVDFQHLIRFQYKINYFKWNCVYWRINIAWIWTLTPSELCNPVTNTDIRDVGGVIITITIRVYCNYSNTAPTRTRPNTATALSKGYPFCTNYHLLKKPATVRHFSHYIFSYHLCPVKSMYLQIWWFWMCSFMGSENSLTSEHK